jgi:hypothetical protein
LRGMWLTRNDFVFNKHVWLDVKIVLKRILRLRVEWEPIFKVIFFGEIDSRGI